MRRPRRKQVRFSSRFRPASNTDFRSFAIQPPLADHQSTLEPTSSLNSSRAPHPPSSACQFRSTARGRGTRRHRFGAALRQATAPRSKTRNRSSPSSRSDPTTAPVRPSKSTQPLPRARPASSTMEFSIPSPPLPLRPSSTGNEDRRALRAEEEPFVLRSSEGIRTQLAPFALPMARKPSRRGRQTVPPASSSPLVPSSLPVRPFVPLSASPSPPASRRQNLAARPTVAR